jgi:hypothetical protein
MCALIGLYSYPALSQDDAAWKKMVTEAKKTGDAGAMLALAREALSPMEVRASGATHSDQVHPEDNQPAPVINFDAGLNAKTTYATNGVFLETSPAYYFLARGTPYVVLGPNALNPRSPIFTRMTAEHELFHAKRHGGDPRPLVDRELETWTHVFVTYFHDVHPFKQRWVPLVAYYEDADAGEREAALEKLVAYYRTPPADADAVRAAFDEWLGRRRKDDKTMSSRLVADLERALTAAR